jgi:hypothetical protein
LGVVTTCCRSQRSVNPQPHYVTTNKPTSFSKSKARREKGGST